MGRILLTLTLAFMATTVSAPAATTQEFLDLCGNDELACANRVEVVRIDAVKAGAKFCLPKTMSLEGYANEVTYWIGEQALDMAQPDTKSITAALKALYTCKPAQGSKP